MSLEDLGFSAARLLAGFCGGIVHAFVLRRSVPVEMVGSVVTGTLTANFLGPAAAHYTPGWLGEGGNAFLVGLCALVICQGIITLTRARISSNSKTKNKP